MEPYLMRKSGIPLAHVYVHRRKGMCMVRLRLDLGRRIVDACLLQSSIAILLTRCHDFIINNENKGECGYRREKLDAPRLAESAPLRVDLGRAATANKTWLSSCHNHSRIFTHLSPSSIHPTLVQNQSLPDDRSIYVLKESLPCPPTQG